MLLVKLIISLHLVYCAAQDSLNEYNCLRNGECENVCPRGFNRDTNCSSCTDDRLSVSSNCTICEDCNGDCLMGNFTLSVLFHSYLNPDSLCGECRLPEYGVEPVCCDTFNQTENCPSLCEFRSVLSLQAYGESLQYIELPARPPDFDSDNITTFPVGPDAFNVSNITNPITIQLNTWTGRFQIYVVVYDSYRINNTPSVGAFAVDRFAINVTLDGIPTSLPRETYHGIYGIAQLDLSFEIQSDNYFILPTTSPIRTPDANSATPDTPPDISSTLNMPPDLSSTGTTASGSEEEVPKGDDCAAFMNSYRILQILVITLPIVAVIVTVVVMTIFIYLIHCCRKYYSTKIQNHTFQITELSVKENPSNPNFPLKTGSLHHDCDTNPSYDTVKSTTNVSYGVVKSTIIDGGNNEKNGTDNYYYT